MNEKLPRSGVIVNENRVKKAEEIVAIAAGWGVDTLWGIGGGWRAKRARRENNSARRGHASNQKEDWQAT